MARLPRLFVEGHPQHVVLRGNNRQDIFLREGDRHFFRANLDDASRRYGLAIHAYVFMSNHIHLLASPEQPDSLARMFQSVGPRYVGYFNRHHRRTGTLFEGRHKAVLIQADRHFLACMRYIELNPVRAGIVAHPGAYAWSSYGFNAWGRGDGLVSAHPEYLALGLDAASRTLAYRTLFDPAIDLGFARRLRESIQGGWAVGDGQFVEWTGQVTGRRPAPNPKGRKEGWRKLSPKLNGA